MVGRLAGKTCFVSAGGQGIGRASAEAFLNEGAIVVATDIAADSLASLADLGARTAVLDVTDVDAIHRFFADQPAFDVLFNCAGYVDAGALLDTQRGNWNRSFAINVTSMFDICQAALPAMIANGGGSIINMASVAGSIIGVPGRCAYGATKGAVIGLTKSIAKDYVRDNIRCNAICPGTVHTPSLEERVRAMGPDLDANWKSFLDRQPMGRLGTAGEIAALAVYLASDESAFTTGTAHVIDGGWSG
jgi:2-keto-3-deoxy-L-fuconate dehydrogenase